MFTDSHAVSQEPEAAPELARAPVIRWFYRAAGSLFVALGVAGIALPLLPSTPFFLLAAGCFGKSSPGAYRWLLTNRYFGAQLRAYREHRGVTVRSKIIAIATIWVGISFSILVFHLPLLVAALLVIIAASVSFYLSRLRSIPGETPALATERSSWG